MNNAIKQAFKDRSFVIVGIVLFISALGIQTTSAKLKFYTRKLPVPLKKSLSNFETDKVWPYKFVEKMRMAAEVEEALGTKDYVQLRFQDTGKNEKDFGREILFFVTYYTGNPDQVPHIPDVCYLGGGFDPEGSFDSSIKVPGLGLKDDTLPVRVLFFKNSRSLSSYYHIVIYFFSVNGNYVEERTKVRWYLGNIWTKYAYFSKVEMSVISLNKPDMASVLKVAERFFQKTVPVLASDHWQNWDTFIKETRK